MLLLLALLLAVLFLFIPFALCCLTGILMMRRQARNRAAAPGNPGIGLPLSLPLVTVPKVREGLRKSAEWLLTWPSYTELLMIFQVGLLLVPPFPQLLNNVLEEVLSWFGGKHGDTDGVCPDVFRDPHAFLRFIPVLVKRVCRSGRLFFQWYPFLLGQSEMVNLNHALNNYFQGTDFALPAEFEISSLVEDPWITKQKTQLMAVCSRLAYERWHVARDIVSQKWKGFSFECAWHFDQITLVPADGQPRQSAYVKTSAMLLTSLGGEVAILAFRGTEPLENVGWLTDFDVVPPPDDPNVQNPWQYGKYHSGFRQALGLNRALRGDPSVNVGYLIQEGGNLIREPVVHSTPYDIITAKIRAVLGKGGKLYVTGHSLGGALANLYVAAAKIPPDTDGRGLGQVDCGLYTFGQPRVGNNLYNRELQRALRSAERVVRYTRVVNTNDIVPRVPPPLDLFYQHSGQLVFLKPARTGAVPHDPPIEFLQEQPSIFRTWAITEGTQKAWFATDDYRHRRPNSSLLTVVLAWLSVYTFLIPVLIFLPVLVVLDTMSCVALVVLGVVLLGLPVGILDHSLAGYDTALVNSVDNDWAGA